MYPTTDFQSIYFSTLIEVGYMCLVTNNAISLTIENIGPDAIFDFANVTVIKVR